MNEDDFICCYLDGVKNIIKRELPFIRTRQLTGILLSETNFCLSKYQIYIADNNEFPSIIYVTDLLEDFLDRLEVSEKEFEAIDFMPFHQFIEKYDDLVYAEILTKPIYIDEQIYIRQRETWRAGQFYDQEEELGRKTGYSETYYQDMLYRLYTDFLTKEYPAFYKQFELNREI